MTQNLSTPSAPTALVQYSQPQYPSVLPIQEENLTESTNFRIKKIMDDEKLLEDEVRIRNAMVKKYGRLMGLTDAMEFTLISADILVGFLAYLVPGVGAVVSTTAFSGIAVISGISKLVHNKLNSKKMKHCVLSTVAQTTLCNIATKVSKAISDGYITHEEFEDIQTVINEWKSNPPCLPKDASKKPILNPDTIELLSKQAAQKAQEDLLEQIKKINTTKKA